MSVVLKRDTGFVGVMGKFSIILNDEKVGVLRANESIELDFPEETATLQLSQLGTKTNKLVVKKGERVDLTSSFWGKYGSFVFISFFFLTDIFFDHWIRYSVLFLYMIALFATQGLFYRIEKIPL